MAEQQRIARLVVTEPASRAGGVMIFSQPEMLIGRDATADFVFDDEFVSRRHALVTTDSSGTVTISDLNSTSGTFVNDEQLAEPRMLQAGDVVRIADVVARFEPADTDEKDEPRTELISVAQTPAPGSRQRAPTPVPPVADAPMESATVVVELAEPVPDDVAGSGGTSGTAGDGARTGSGDAYTVTGTVSSPVLPAIGGLAVHLLDINIGEQPSVLVTTSTASDGSYAFDHLITSSYLRQHHKRSPDLQVQVPAKNGGPVLASSIIRYHASTTETLNVVLPADATGLPSEYELLTANLSAVYSGDLAALKETSSQQDITYLANTTGWDARAVALAALAAQFSQMTPPPPIPVAAQTPTRPTPLAAAAKSSGGDPPEATAPSTISVAPEFCYALFRAGLPTDADGLFRANSAQIQAIWAQAVTDNVIPATAASQIADAVTNFRALAASHVLTAAPTIGVSTLEQMLTPTLADPADQQHFAQLYTQYQGDWESLWPAVQNAFDTDVANKLQLAGQLHYLTINNAPLVAALTAKAPITTTLDLVTGGYYRTENWTPLIGTNPIPPQITGATPSEQAANYAQYLAAQVRLAHPTAVLADQVKNKTIPIGPQVGLGQPATVPANQVKNTAGPIADNEDLATNVAQFLSTHQADFQIGTEPIDAYIARTGLTGVQPEVITQIQRLHRVYQLTPDDTSMAVLLHHNLHSAYALTRYDSAGFVRAFAGQLGGEATATAIHNRAKQIFSTTLNVAVSYLKARTEPGLGGSTTPILTGFPPQTSTPTDPVPAYATMEDLFGSMDYCNCSDCSSILSPAAYLVDLLHYLDQPVPIAGVNPQGVLLARRPDLQYLPLTCANTNTAMPYIDLVNETLEYLVANGGRHQRLSGP